MSVKQLKYIHDFESAVSTGAVVVDYFTLWCGPCLQIAPEVEKLAHQYPSIHFYKVNVDEASDIATSVGISAMPTFHFYKNGKLVDKIVGANLPALKRKVAALA